jgi:hypothetical protein
MASSSSSDPRTGYKLVNCKTWKGLFGSDVYTVGSTHALPDGVDPVICVRGFHYCARAIDCLCYVPLRAGVRLLVVRIPDEAHIVGDGHKFAASKLIVECEVELPSDLLTGTTTMRVDDTETTYWFVNGKTHDGPNGEPACSSRGPWGMRSRWLRDDGRPIYAVYRSDGTLDTETWESHDKGHPLCGRCVTYCADGVTIYSTNDVCDNHPDHRRVTTFDRKGRTATTSLCRIRDSVLNSPDGITASYVAYSNGSDVVEMLWHKDGVIVDRVA